MTAIAADTRPRRSPFDLHPLIRSLIVIGGTVLGLACATAFTKVAMGMVPVPAYARQPAIVIHLATALASIPLGMWVLLSRKGDARHRMLGKIWIVLMVTTAVSAMFIQHAKGIQFSWLHLFVPLTLMGAWQTVRTARAHQIARHKAAVIRLFLLALILPGLFTFIPTRIMGGWLLG